MQKLPTTSTDRPTGYQSDAFDLEERPGCLSGLLKLFALNWVYSWLQRNAGFGRGGCGGTGCGIILLVIASIFFCSIIFGTNWFDFGF